MKRKKKSKGIITVFVTLMLVPMVVCTGTMVDAARLKLYSSQAAMVADTYSEVILSEYDNLLKDLYGLFSITQNEEGLQAIETLAEYTKYSFIPNGDKEEGDELEGFMPYKDAKLEVSYEAVEGATLSDRDVLSTQIGDFMKFRAIAEVFSSDDNNILEKITGFENAKKDMEIVEERSKLTDGCTEILKKISEYYQVMKCLDDYPSYKSDIEIKFKKYANALVAICTNMSFTDENYTYQDYTYYLDNESRIDAAKEKVDEKKRIEEENQAEYDYEEWYEETYEEDYEPQLQTVPTVTETEEWLAEKWVDVDDFQKALERELNKWDKATATPKKNLIAFGEVEDKMKELSEIASEISEQLVTLKEKADNIQSMLDESENANLKESMGEEIKRLENITEIADGFEKTVNKLNSKDISGMDKTNKSTWEEEIAKLEEIEAKILDGEQRDTNWAKTVNNKLDWFSFREDSEMNEFYLELKEICESKSGSGTEANESAGDEKVKEVNGKTDEVKEQQEKDEEEELAKKELRNISDTLKTQLIGHTKETENTDDDMPGFGSLFTGDATIGTLANTAINKFMLVTYNFGMFSNRVTSVEPPEQEDEASETAPTVTPAVTPAAGDSEKENEEYKEYSLTKVEKSKDVNYMYEAELEYLIAGKTDAKKNLNHCRNIINTIRMSMNFIATYTIKDIHNAIEEIAQATAEVVAATGVGAPLAPVVRVAVSGALRLMVATLESVEDWKLLKAREDVLFYKNELGDMNTADIGRFLEGKVDDTEDAPKSPDNELRFSYEDYLYIMMLVFVDDDKLLDRTANLITLNVNQSQNTTGGELTTLDFKMTDTVTAVKSTCQVDLKFMIVPENMSNMFLNYNGASDEKYKQTIQKLDDGTYAYSIIRGY